MPDSIDVLVVADPLEQFNPRADSTFVMMSEAIRRGHRTFHAEIGDLSLRGEEAWGVARPTRATATADGPSLVFSGDAEARPLRTFRVILMRKDPPVDDAYLIATWILDRARRHALVVNDPRGLRDLNEKLAILEFPQLIPATKVLRRATDLRAALQEFGGTMIVKPVFGFGGREILMARDGDPNLSSIFELATAEGTRWTVAQAYVPEASKGDKRILIIDGEPAGAVLRVPAAGELRNNFHAGGAPRATELDSDDLRICEQIGPFLRERGQLFAGIDVIGGRLTEINVTSPTGMQEINRLAGLTGDATMEARFWQALERMLGASQWT